MTVGGFGTAAAYGVLTRGDTQRECVHERTAKAFGTSVRLVVQHACKKTAEFAILAAFDELELIESLMSVYRPDSQLSWLNDHGRIDSAHPYLQRIIRKAGEISVATRGAFDITVQLLWQTYKSSSDNGRLPNAEEVRNSRKTVGFRNVEVLRNRIRVAHGSRVTLNGIAQGFATDRVKHVLLRNGVDNALIDVGELGGIGSKDRVPWKAGIQHPRREDAFVAFTLLGDRCLATSGDYETTFTSDFRHHHIFDPRTGVSPTELSSVSVLAPTATEADALSTALLVMGLREGSTLLSARPGIDALFVRKDGRVSATGGFSLGDIE
jgi:thiamine biosynthesis lipoprotein